jgi:hypothetical protein
MSDKETMTWTDGRGKPASREVNLTLAVNKFRGTPGHALLIIAANTHLSVSDLWRLLGSEGIGRSRSYIQRRRWLFQDPDTINVQGTKPNLDGKDDRAFQIMRDNPTLSLRQLSRLLKQHGIHRGKDWIMHNRCR